MKKIYLTQCQYAVVDDEDYNYLMRWNWCAVYDKKMESFYSHRRLGRGTISMHRVILHAREGQYVDHIDHNTLNNQKSNIRLVTVQENHRNKRLMRNNTSGVCGVYHQKHSNKWKAMIKIDRKLVHLGYFRDKKDAIAIRKSAEIEYGFHGNHGRPLPEAPNEKSD